MKEEKEISIEFKTQRCLRVFFHPLFSLDRWENEGRMPPPPCERGWTILKDVTGTLPHRPISFRKICRVVRLPLNCTVFSLLEFTPRWSWAWMMASVGPEARLSYTTPLLQPSSLQPFLPLCPLQEKTGPVGYWKSKFNFMGWEGIPHDSWFLKIIVIAGFYIVTDS